MEMGLGTDLKHTKECTRWYPKANDKGNAKEKETVIIADRRAIFSETAPISRNASKGKGLQGKCYTFREKVHPARECPKGKEREKSKEREMATKEKTKGRGAGAKASGK